MARPKHLRRGKYRMTPARRAALKKAQTASAKKRRRRDIAKSVGRTAARGTVQLGGAFVAARLSSYIVKPSTAKKDYNYVKGFFSKKKDVVAVSALPKPLKNARMTWIP